MLTSNSRDTLPYALVFHTGFSSVRFFLAHGSRVIKSMMEENKKVSKTLLPHIDSLLKEHHLTLKDIQFIAATTGPAPLTTLRSTLATINGIAAASGIPLIGLSTLDILSEEPLLSEQQASLAILDAFCGEIHFKIYKDESVVQGTSTIENLATQLIQMPYNSFIIKGEMAEAYKKQLDALVPVKKLFLDSENDTSNDFLAKQALQAFENNHVVPQLFPLYLKPAVFSSK